MRRMQGVDTTFFEAETPTMHLHVVGVLLLDPSTSREPWGYETVVRLLEERLDLLPPFRWRAVSVPGRLDQPRWVEDPDFCLQDHVHRAVLPEPADLDALCRFVGGVASDPLDRDCPLWEMHVIESMSDGSVAIVTKLHHSFMDGGAGGDVMASLFDLGPEGEPVLGAATPWQPDALPSPTRLVVESLGGAVARTARLPALVIETARGVVGSARAMRSRRAPGPPLLGPRTRLNGALTAQRSVALTRCSLRDVKAAKDMFGVTVNDVVLAAATAALREELLDLDALPDGPLIAMVPISERGAGEAEFSNRTSAVKVALPVQVADPIERLRAIRELALDAKDRHRALGDGLAEGWAAVLPPLAVHAMSQAYTKSGAARFLPPVFNLIVSNIPGPPVPLYLGGAKVTHIYPMGPLLEGAGLNITLLSQGDLVDVGVITCPAMIDDPARIGKRFLAAVDELVHLAASDPDRSGRDDEALLDQHVVDEVLDGT